jgi:diguanylate cyclase (GGDEF)-like protein
MIKKYIYLIVNLLLLIPGIIFVYTYAYNYIDKEVIHIQEKRDALIEMQSIYKLITNLQKVRGLSNIHKRDNKIIYAIRKLEDKNLYISQKLKNKNIDKILQRHSVGTITDFQNYTSDIEALLLSYKLTAYNAKLTLNSDITEYLLSKSITNGLPYLVEYFARIRGLASSVSNHKLNQDIQIQIQNQIYMIEELLKNAKDISFLNNSNFSQILLQSQKEEIRYIKKELLETKTIHLSGLEIFNRITKNIDFLNQLYIKNMQKLMKIYNNEIMQKSHIQSLIILICILSIIIVIAINFFYFSKIQKYIKEVEHLNIIDPMTQLYNRRFLENFIEKFISQVQRQNEYFSILMIDIDFFKKVNDTYGHDVGDKVIIAVANVLQENIRKSDLAIRYGGEEFMVLLHYADKEAAYTIANKLKEKFAQIEFETKKGSFSKTLSIGISEFPKDNNSIWECIKLADEALYVAKTSGRDKVVLYEREEH